jgi:hypothetical protein
VVRRGAGAIASGARLGRVSLRVGLGAVIADVGAVVRLVEGNGSYPDERTGPLRFGPPGHGSQRIDLDEALRPAQARHHEHRDCGGVRAPDLP